LIISRLVNERHLKRQTYYDFGSIVVIVFIVKS